MKVEEVLELVEEMLEDATLPRNVKRALQEVDETLKKEGDVDVKVVKCIYTLEKVTEDQNILPHVRMQLWNVISALESVKTEKA